MKSSNRDERQEFKYRLDRLKDSVDPRYLVESLGFNAIRETSKEIRTVCKIHGGDNKTAFRFNKDTKTWVCFSHRCHEVFGNDIIGLIKATLSVDFMGAVKYLESLVGDVGSSSYIEYKRKKEKDYFIRSRKLSGPKPSIVTEECLQQFKPFRTDYFERQGFTKETLDFFEIAGGYTDGYGFIRDIIPIRDDKGCLSGYSLRDIRDDAPDDDYKYISTLGFDKDKVIYNLHNAKNFLNEKQLIIVEGQKSVWRLYEYGIKNVAAVMGSSITSGQVNLLCTYAFKGIVIMFDNDEPGITGCVNACKEVGSKMEIIPIFMIETDENGKGLDPSDLSKEEVYSYLKRFRG